MNKFLLTPSQPHNVTCKVFELLLAISVVFGDLAVNVFLFNPC